MEETARKACVVLCTFPDAGTAGAAAETLVSEGLAACAALVEGVLSVYRWEGRLCRERETQLVAKTFADAWPALQERLRSLHPYRVPEMLLLPVQDGWPDYLAWMGENVSTGRPGPR